MIFSELYSAYYNAIARILAAVLDGESREAELQKAVQEYAFSESILTILPALKSGKWQLLCPDLTTPLRHAPTLPLTLLEKRWLKAISLDPRIRLFGGEFPGLEDVEPLFTPEDYFVYDKYSDGDPFEDEGYIARFRMILQAIREKKPLRLEVLNRRDEVVPMNLLPLRLEYSEKDDKFRLIGAGLRFGSTVNLGRVVFCRPFYGEGFPFPESNPVVNRSLTLEIRDERNTLERCMLHFAHFEKQAERIGDGKYRAHIRYAQEDETELVIRVLSFGPTVEVIDPPEFRQLIANRLKRQKEILTFGGR